MSRTALSEKLIRFETSDWRTRPSRRMEGTICQLQIIRAEANVCPSKLNTIAKLEKRLLNSLAECDTSSSILARGLSLLLARQIVSEFL